MTSRFDPDRFRRRPQRAKKPGKPNRKRRNFWIEKIARRVVISTRPHNCAKCGKARDPMFLYCHHVIEISRGGSFHPRNIILICKPCHIHLHRQE